MSKDADKKGRDFSISFSPSDALPGGLGLPPRRASSGTASEALPSREEIKGRLSGEGFSSGLVTTQAVDLAAGERTRNRTVPLPDRIWRAVQDRASREGFTAKYYILKGLQMQGFPVSEYDLEDKRGAFLKNAAKERLK